MTHEEVDIAGLCVEGIVRAVKTANLFNTVGCNGVSLSSRPVGNIDFILYSFRRNTG